MHRLLLVVAAVLVVLANCQGEQQHGPEMSRYFNEDGRTADYMPDAMKGFVTKRKQFYAWAGKRSAPDMEKRRQFYAWAGK